MEKLALTLAVWGALAAGAFAQRPVTLTAAGGTLTLKGIQYAANTLADEAIAARGLGQLSVTIAGVTVSVDQVALAKLTSQAGLLKTVELTLPAPLTLPRVLGGSSELSISQGTLSYDTATGALALSGGGTLRLPVRGTDGKPLSLAVPSLTLARANGTTTVALRGVALTGDLSHPEVTVQAAPANFDLRWGTDNKASWKLGLPQARVSLATPGLASDTDKPLRARVANLTYDSDQNLAFDEAELEREVKVGAGELPGFELVVKSGRASMVEGNLRLKSVVADLTLPEVVTNPTGGRAVVRGLALQWDDGSVAAVGPDKLGPNGLDLRMDGVVLTVKRAALDLSQTLKAPRVPAMSPANAPEWQGLWIEEGELTLPADLSNPKITVTDFLVDSLGVTGTARLTNLSLSIKGFPVQQVGGSIVLRQNQVVGGSLEGTLSLPGMGSLTVLPGMTSAGQVTLAVKQSESLKLEGLGAELRKLRGQVRTGGGLPPRLVLGGALSLQDAPGLPEGFKTLTLSLSEFSVDASGKLYLPKDGCLTFPEPKRVAIGPLGVELRRIGFETRNNQLYSLTLSGGADLGDGLEGLPLSGGVDFEGLTVALDGPDADKLPEVRVGGVRVQGQVEGIGRIEGDLSQKNLPTFGPSLYGGASLQLDCLGGAGIELDFLLAPQKLAWFVGGGVQLDAASAIRVMLTTPTGPVPLFNIYGFGGGFGFNVAPKDGLPPAERGRISDPERQLEFRQNAVLLQASLLVGDPVSGNVWWGETTLTLAFNPTIVELAGKLSLLDPEGPRFADLDAWEAMDRTASVFVNFDTRGPALTLGGGLDFYFPTRQANLLELHGQAELRLAPKEQYVRVGWKDAGQKPVSVSFLKVADDILDIQGEAGFEVDLVKTTGTFYFDTRAKLTASAVKVEGTLKGRLALDARQRSAKGKLVLRGMADFELFEARVEAELDADFNTATYREKLHLEGTITGKAGPFEARIPFEQTFRTK